MLKKINGSWHGTFFIGASQTNVKAISCRKSSYSCYRRRSIDENCGISENGEIRRRLVAIPEITRSVKLAQRNVMRRNYISRRPGGNSPLCAKTNFISDIFQAAFSLPTVLFVSFIRKKQSGFLFTCRERGDSFSRQNGMLNWREMSLKVSTHP